MIPTWKGITTKDVVCVYFFYTICIVLLVGKGFYMDVYSIQVFGLFLYFCRFSCDNTVLMCHSFVFVCLWCICIVIILNKFEDWWPYLPLT